MTCPIKRCGAIYEADEGLAKRCTFIKCSLCHKAFNVKSQVFLNTGKYPFLYYRKSFLFYYYKEICTLLTETVLIENTNMLDKDEYIEKTLKVAKRNAWTRCPRCQWIIEKTVSFVLFFFKLTFFCSKDASACIAFVVLLCKDPLFNKPSLLVNNSLFHCSCYRCGGIQTNHGCYNQCEGLSNEKLVILRKSMFILSDEN